MSERRTQVTPEMEEFFAPYWGSPDALLVEIQQDIHRRGKFEMQISFEQVAFHAWLCRLIGARRVLEVGTYLGLSSAAFAQAMGPEGHVDTVEFEPEHADIAEEWHRKGGLQERISVHRGAGLDVVPKLAGPYDLCFLDGDKAENPVLLAACIPLTRKGGLILADNAFRDGKVMTEETDATRRTLALARELPGVDPVVVPVADGILVCRVV